jgi:hypothetical protein
LWINEISTCYITQIGIAAISPTSGITVLQVYVSALDLSVLQLNIIPQNFSMNPRQTGRIVVFSGGSAANNLVDVFEKLAQECSLS